MYVTWSQACQQLKINGLLCKSKIRARRNKTFAKGEKHLFIRVKVSSIMNTKPLKMSPKLKKFQKVKPTSSQDKCKNKTSLKRWRKKQYLFLTQETCRKTSWRLSSFRCQKWRGLKKLIEWMILSIVSTIAWLATLLKNAALRKIKSGGFKMMDNLSLRKKLHNQT